MLGGLVAASTVCVTAFVLSGSKEDKQALWEYRKREKDIKNRKGFDISRLKKAPRKFKHIRLAAEFDRKRITKLYVEIHLDELPHYPGEKEYLEAKLDYHFP